MVVATFKEWSLWCSRCEEHTQQLAWDYDLPLPCTACGLTLCLDYDEPMGKAPGIIGDDIPGGILVRHGLVDADGNPRRFYSKTDIKRAANEAGLTIADDTPKPYKVPWSGQRKVPEKVEPIVKS